MRPAHDLTYASLIVVWGWCECSAWLARDVSTKHPERSAARLTGIRARELRPPKAKLDDRGPPASTPAVDRDHSQPEPHILSRGAFRAWILTKFNAPALAVDAHGRMAQSDRQTFLFDDISITHG